MTLEKKSQCTRKIQAMFWRNMIQALLVNSFKMVSSLAYSLTLRMGKIYSSETFDISLNVLHSIISQKAELFIIMSTLTT
jgi:hypothetical protein